MVLTMYITTYSVNFYELYQVCDIIKKLINVSHSIIFDSVHFL